MEWILSILSTLAIFAAALVLLVFFHELGHFIAAKFFGMRVEKFSLGFPPKIFGIQKGETEYSIGATPLGGYVKISGMIDESMDTDHVEEEVKPWEFRSKPVWQRIIVITAGVIFNMILAVFIYAGIAYTNGETKVDVDSVNGIYVEEGSLASQVGFQTGDKLVGVNGEEVAYYNDLISPEEMTASSLNYMVIRDGRQTTVPVADSLLNEIGGIIHWSNALPSQISEAVEGSPADKAGIQGDDVITSINGEEINYWVQLTSIINNTTPQDSLTVTVNRGGQTHRMTLSPDENRKLGIYPVNPENVFNVEQFRYGLAESFNVGTQRTESTFTGIIQGFSKLFSGEISVRENLGGPVAIANMTKQATDTGGMVGFWAFTAFLSITLAIMNILPIPALDGGHLMFLIYEGITRREPSAKVRMALQQIGFLILIVLMIFVTFNDILRQF